MCPTNVGIARGTLSVAMYCTVVPVVVSDGGSQFRSLKGFFFAPALMFLLFLTPISDLNALEQPITKIHASDIGWVCVCVMVGGVAGAQEEARYE